MNRIEFEKKYTEMLDSLHLQLVAIEFKEDLKTMVAYECVNAINELFNDEEEYHEN